MSPVFSPAGPNGPPKENRPLKHSSDALRERLIVNFGESAIQYVQIQKDRILLT